MKKIWIIVCSVLFSVGQSQAMGDASSWTIIKTNDGAIGIASCDADILFKRSKKRVVQWPRFIQYSMAVN